MRLRGELFSLLSAYKTVTQGQGTLATRGIIRDGFKRAGLPVPPLAVEPADRPAARPPVVDLAAYIAALFDGADVNPPAAF
jgi:hypothetical protein